MGDVEMGGKDMATGYSTCQGCSLPAELTLWSKGGRGRNGGNADLRGEAVAKRAGYLHLLLRVVT